MLNLADKRQPLRRDSGKTIFPSVRRCEVDLILHRAIKQMYQTDFGMMLHDDTLSVITMDTSDNGIYLRYYNQAAYRLLQTLLRPIAH